MPLDQFFAQTSCNFFGQHGLACAGLALDEQGTLKRHRCVYRHPEIIGRNITLCSFKFHIEGLCIGVRKGPAD